MKGPYQRLKHDLRRLWVCPVCQHRAHSSGAVTTLLCRCQQQVEPAARRYMRLVEASTLRLPGRAAIEPAPSPPAQSPAAQSPSEDSAPVHQPQEEQTL